ncbi:hypothetical protein GBAR_LOCUS2893 [Geodia barretti]|jgi:predicted enzyme related to lactoylglutathione lyase|uniref:VOC domain-containing protein n=1 Tax=Geodia barretti TaxID=519541 RepID=A0AA35W5L1_GEOBA|nr:hypothetical protein GBAR_LOCUS2893 [Geodia barretti]
MGFVCNHLHLRSEDPDNAAKFYVDNFGASIAETRPLSTTVSHRLELNGQPLLTVSGRADGEDPVAGSTEPRYGLDHFGFETDDIQAAFSQFKSTGANIICDPWTMPSGSQVMFVEAPDKVSLEIIQRPS